MRKYYTGLVEKKKLFEIEIEIEKLIQFKVIFEDIWWFIINISFGL